MNKLRGVGRNARRRFSTRGGDLCDERCWEYAVRQRQFDRRLATPGSVRLV